MPKFLDYLPWAILAGVLVGAAWRAATRMQCIRLGYPEYRAGGFCVARVNGTDVVVTLEEARSKPRR